MILPSSYLATLLLLVISMICWGSWANTQKLAGPWRFELYYYDFAIGFLLLTVAAAFTFGSLRTSELTFEENFLLTGNRNMIWAIAAGMVFNLGNMFLAATVSIAGLAVAFPMALGTALVIGTLWSMAFGAQANVLLSVGGAGLVLVALVVAAYAHSSHLDALLEATKKAALQVDPRSKQARRTPRGPSAAQAVVLGVVSGVAFGFVRPLLDMAREGDSGVAPYGLGLLFAGGMFVVLLVLGPFFFNFPVSGGPIRLRDYFSGSGRQHLLGVLGGLLAGAAILISFLTAAAPATARVAPGISYALSQSGTVLAALWGLLVWREFRGASDRIRTLFAGVLILFAAGVAMLAVAQS